MRSILQAGHIGLAKEGWTQDSREMADEAGQRCYTITQYVS
jgi:hypothetical protein